MNLASFLLACHYQIPLAEAPSSEDTGSDTAPVESGETSESGGGETGGGETGGETGGGETGGGETGGGETGGGETGGGWTDPDTTCDGTWSEADLAGYAEGQGCDWGYVWLRDGSELYSLDLHLDEADLLASRDASFSLAVGSGVDVAWIDLTSGTEEAWVWTCSDYMESQIGTGYTGVSGTVTVDVGYLCSYTDDLCGDDEWEYHATVTTSGVTVQSRDGTRRDLPDLVVRVDLGADACGG